MHAIDWDMSNSSSSVEFGTTHGGISDHSPPNDCDTDDTIEDTVDSHTSDDALDDFADGEDDEVCFFCPIAVLTVNEIEVIHCCLCTRLRQRCGFPL